MRKSLLTLLLVLLAITNMAFAQERVVTGTVTQKSDGSSIPGATISVKGTRTATVTNQNGKFSIKVSSPNAVLVVSFVGMIKTEITVGSQSTIDVEMISEVTSLDEVIVVAYGTTKKSDFTGAAVQINNKKLTLAPITNITKALEGVSPGVQVTAGSGQPGAAPTIQIRGFGSISYSGEPLIVVDNVPFNGSLANINPDDIESVTVLKDASSTALYGNQAANGVVVVTTKKGNKDRNVMQVKISRGITARAVPEYDRVNAMQYYPLMWESYKNSLMNTSGVPADVAAQIASGVYPLTGGAQVYNTKTYSSIKQLLGINPFNVADNAIVGIDGKLNANAKLLYPNDLNWEKSLERVGQRGDYGVTFSGGGAKSDYFISMGYLSEKGFLIKSDYERVTGRVSLNSNPVEWFKTGINISGTMTKSNQANDASSTGYINPFSFARYMGPIYPIYQHNTNGDYLWDANGNKQYDLGPLRPSSASPGRHILAETNYNDNLFKRNAWTAKTFGEVTITKDLKFTTNLSIELSNYAGATYDNKIVGDGAPLGRASRTDYTSSTFNFNQLINYTRSFGKNNFEFLVGHENQSYKLPYLYGSRSGQNVDGNTELINFTNVLDVYSYTDTYNKEGYLSRLNYNWANKYYLMGSFRRDASAKFADKKRWGNFWAVGGSWKIDQESFMKDLKPIDALRLRASYGTVGSDNGIGNYAYQLLYTLGRNNATEPGIVQATTAGNPDILWETNSNFDVALEFTVLKRFIGTFEYYERQSKNLLFNVPQPLSSGIAGQQRNIGIMKNSGYELSLKTLILKESEFKWNVDLNLSTVKNIIKKMPPTNPEIISGTKKLAVGHSMYDYWLRESMGVDPADGSALYRAVSFVAANSKIIGKDTVTTDYNNARYHYAGTAIPDLYGSIASNFSYKNFDLTIAFSFQFGGKIYDANYASLMTGGGSQSAAWGAAISTDILNRWQKPGDITNVPRLDNSKITNFSVASDRWLTTGTYFNFKTINIGYSLPQSIIRRFQMQNVRVYLSGDNLWLSASRKGLNPTQSFTGVTSNAYVPARVVTVGINVTL